MTINEGWTEEEMTDLRNDVPAPYKPLTTDERIDLLFNELGEFRAEHAAMVEQVQKLIANIEPYIKDIAPMIDAIANNPMFKMFTGTKGNKSNGA